MLCIAVVGRTTNVCKDPYRLAVAAMGPGTSIVVLNFDNISTRKPCFKAVLNPSVHVFTKINDRVTKGRFTNPNHCYQNKIDKILTNFAGYVNGIYIGNPGRFMVNYFTTINDVFDRIKAAGLKLTVNAYGEKYNL